MRKRSGMREALVVLCGWMWSLAAAAQTPPLPERPSVDANGVDLATGTTIHTTTDIAIGQPGAGGLTFGRIMSASGWTHSYDNGFGYTSDDGVTSTFSFWMGGHTETFTKAMSPSSSPYVSPGGGSTLVEDSTSYTHTSGNGTVTVVTKNFGTHGWPHVTSQTLPDGEVRTFNYITANMCVNAGCTIKQFWMRLQSVTNNRGYQIKLVYAASGMNIDIPVGQVDAWKTLTQAIGVNMAVDWCDPIANGCSGTTQTWPSVTYDLTNGLTITDQLGGSSTYTQTSVRWRGSTTNNVVYTLDSSLSTVTGATVNGKSWTYVRTPTSEGMQVEVTDPASRKSTYVFDGQTHALKRYKNTAGEETLYQNDTNGRPQLITLPTGETIHYQYDARGNITETRRTSFPTGSPDLVWTANYDSTCSNPKTCNKPNWTRDPAAQQTDFTYAPANGALSSITLPAGANGLRPVTNFAYTPYQAYYKNSSGSIVAAGSSVYYLTSVSQCRTTPGCSDTSSDQLRTETNYGVDGVANNRLPISTTVRDGASTYVATTTTDYDNVGNAVAVNGPLSGDADKVVTTYDALRRVTGTIGPDPNDTPRTPIGVHTIYNDQGLPGTVETGNLPAQTSAWSSLTPSQSIVREFDADGRVTKESLMVGTTAYAVQQTTYDNLGRVDCKATRMNPATFGSLPSACARATDGTFGPDRIVKYGYDTADRVTSLISGYGGNANEQITEQSMTYLPGGRLDSVTDGNGNQTTYSYDAYGRRQRICYPDPGKVCASTAVDYEEFSYNANSQVTSIRRRSGDVIQTPRDALGRVTSQHVVAASPPLNPAVDDLAFAYDLQGRPLSALNSSSQGITQTYDELGRLKTRADFGKTLQYEYDLAGRRVKLTYPDSFYVLYTYTNLNELKTIKDHPLVGAETTLATYTYDGMGARIGLARGSDPATTTYVPDAIKRLQQLQQNLSGTASDLDTSFTYNPAGQITKKTFNSNEAAYSWMPSPGNSTVAAPVDGQNKLSTFAGTTVTHDANGSVRTGINNLTYTFDALGQLRKATDGSSNITVEYDPAGMLRRVSAASITDYVYDGGDLIAQYDGSGTLVRRIVHGAGVDEPLVSYDASGNRTWLHADERGSIVTASDVSGVASTIVKYSDSGESGTLVSPFGYTGQLYLADLQAYYYKARMYSPGTGRFLQPDPIRYSDGMNLYRYAAGDPVNAVDPSGLCVIVDTDQGRLVGDGCNAKDPFPSAAIFFLFTNSGSPLGFVGDLARPAGGGTPAAPQGNQNRTTQCKDQERFVGDRLAQQYLNKYGQNAWDQIRQDRDSTMPVPPGTQAEAIRNAEHYLWSYSKVEDFSYAWGAQLTRAVLYNTVKFWANVGEYYGGGLINSPWTYSIPTTDELRSGFAGANDSLFGHSAATCPAPPQP